MNSVQSALKSIAQNISSITTIDVLSDGSKRGAPPTPSSSGIYIDRLGNASGSCSGNTLSITLQGGTAEWEGAVSTTNFYDTFAISQLLALEYIILFTINNGKEGIAVNPNSIYEP